MFYFAQLKFDPRGHVDTVELIRQTIEHRGSVWPAKVQQPIATFDTLTEAMAAARRLNEETA